MLNTFLGSICTSGLFQCTKINIFVVKFVIKRLQAILQFNAESLFSLFIITVSATVLCAEFTKTFLIYFCVDKTGYVVSGMGGGIIWARCGELRDIQQVGRYSDKK
jgi:hypothetical protein